MYQARTWDPCPCLAYITCYYLFFWDSQYIDEIHLPGYTDFFFDIVLLIFFMASSSLVSWRRRLLMPYLIGVVVSGVVVPSGVVVRW